MLGTKGRKVLAYMLAAAMTFSFALSNQAKANAKTAKSVTFTKEDVKDGELIIPAGTYEKVKLASNLAGVKVIAKNVKATYFQVNGYSDSKQITISLTGTSKLNKVILYTNVELNAIGSKVDTVSVRRDADVKMNAAAKMVSLTPKAKGAQIEINKPVGTLQNKAADIAVDLNADATLVKNFEDNTKITLAENATVSKLNNVGNNIEVEGEGTLTRANVSGKGISIAVDIVTVNTSSTAADVEVYGVSIPGNATASISAEENKDSSVVDFKITDKTSGDTTKGNVVTTTNTDGTQTVTNNKTVVDKTGEVVSKEEIITDKNGNTTTTVTDNTGKTSTTTTDATGTVVDNTDKKQDDNAGGAIGGDSTTTTPSTPSTPSTPAKGVGVSGSTTVYKNLEEAIAAASANATITIYETQGSSTNFKNYEIDKALTIKANKRVVIYGTITVKADGVTLDGLTIANRGGGDDAQKNAVNVVAASVTIKNCNFKLNAKPENPEGVANGLCIYPTSSTVNYTIVNNTFTGYNADFTSGEEKWTSTAVMITEGYDLKSRFGLDKKSATNVVIATDNDETSIATSQTYVNCKLEYIHNDYSSDTQYIYSYCVDGNSGAAYFKNNTRKSMMVLVAAKETIELGSDKDYGENTTIVVKSGTVTVTGNATITCGTLVVDESATLSIEDGSKVLCKDFSQVGTVSGNVIDSDTNTALTGDIIVSGKSTSYDSLAAAISDATAGATITINKTQGSTTSYENYNVDKAVTIIANNDAVIYGTITILTNGVTLNGLTIVNRGGGDDVQKNAINVVAHTATITNCKVSLNAAPTNPSGVANGLCIYPTESTVHYTISNNTFTGYNADCDTWTSTAVMITEGYDLNARFSIDGKTATDVIMAADNDETSIATSQTYVNCKLEYIHNDYSNGNQYIYSYCVNGNTSADRFNNEKNGMMVLVGDGETIELDSDKNYGVNTTIVVKSGTVSVTGNATVTCGKLVISAGATLDVIDGTVNCTTYVKNGTVLVSGTSTVNENDVVVEQVPVAAE